MADLIDRQAAVDVFQRLAYDDWNQGASTTWATALAQVAEIIKELPAAQHEIERLDPCDVCKYSPPSAMDGKPCAMCPAEGKETWDE